MNDEPIYKAKRVDGGQWVYGYLFKSWDEYYICWGMTKDNRNMVLVDQNTICRNTTAIGIFDVRIYTGDIVEFYEAETHDIIRRRVYFDDELLTFRLSNTDQPFCKRFEHGFTVVGNIYDMKPEPEKPLITRSGNTWVAYYDGVDYLWTKENLWKSEKAHPFLFRISDKKNIIDGWKPFLKIEFTDEIVPLRPIISSRKGCGSGILIYVEDGGACHVYDKLYDMYRTFHCHFGLATAKELFEDIK
jgi:hypothetical protein